MARNSGAKGLTSIVAVGRDGAIGIANQLPWRLKSDLKFFSKTTQDNVVIMGRKTYESIGGCLPRRENIILSHRASLFPAHPGCSHAHGVGETLFLSETWQNKRTYVIGGAMTYEQFSPFVDRYLITVVDCRFPEADAFFDQSIIGDEAQWEKKVVEIDRIDDPTADEHEFSVIELMHRKPDTVAERRRAAIAEFRRRNPYIAKKDLMKAVANGQPLREAISAF
jgi:dihydrofolate reductase